MLKNIVKFALLGAVGFGVGWLLKVRLPSLQADYWVVFEGVEGVLGGLALGLAAKRGLKGLATIAVFCGIGFSAGIFLGYLLARLLSLASIEQYLVAYGLFTGAFGGVALGLTLGGWKRAIVLALAGAIGFSILPIIMAVWFPISFFGQGSVVGNFLAFFPGVVGGALLGAAAGYLEKG